MEEVRLFDTATRSVRPLKGSDSKELKFYACGPTVYGPAHIGNFRSLVVQDLLVRVWEAAWSDMNIELTAQGVRLGLRLGLRRS